MGRFPGFMVLIGGLVLLIGCPSDEEVEGGDDDIATGDDDTGADDDSVNDDDVADDDAADDDADDSSCPGVEAPTDISGYTYTTLQIGDQCWMGENLKTGQTIDGDMTDNGVVERYCYDPAETYCEGRCGGLYTWNEVMAWEDSDPQGICPAGWHVPTQLEWRALLDEFAGNELDLIVYEGSSGFDAWYCGRMSDGAHNAGYSGDFGWYWTSSYFASGESWVTKFSAEDDSAEMLLADIEFGYSVRCIKD